MSSAARWPLAALRRALLPLLPGLGIEVLARVDSTNSELMRRARAGRCAPALLLAEQQTAGRGRQGRVWHDGVERGQAAAMGPAAQPVVPGAPAHGAVLMPPGAAANPCGAVVMPCSTAAIAPGTVAIASGASATPPPGTAALPSLMLSLGLALAPRDWSGLSLAVGLSVAESLQPVWPPDGDGAGAGSGSQRARLGLKWPNDLWLSDAAGERKLGGILVETASLAAPQPHTGAAHGAASGTAQAASAAGNDRHASARYVVVGIGINMLARSGAGLSMPPACMQELEPGLDAASALLRIAGPLVAMLQAFEASGFAPLRPRFTARDLLRGRSVALSDGRSGSARGVGADGALLLHTASGVQAITSAEISVRPASAAPAATSAPAGSTAPAVPAAAAGVSGPAAPTVPAVPTVRSVPDAANASAAHAAPAPGAAPPLR